MSLWQVAASGSQMVAAKLSASQRARLGVLVVAGSVMWRVTEVTATQCSGYSPVKTGFSLVANAFGPILASLLLNTEMPSSDSI